LPRSFVGLVAISAKPFCDTADVSLAVIPIEAILTTNDKLLGYARECKEAD
jgi:hypothetical protein